MGVYGDLKELMLLVESVRALKASVEELSSIVNDIDKRLVTLEAREDVVLEAASSAASNAATNAAMRMSEGVMERLVRIEGDLEQALLLEDKRRERR